MTSRQILQVFENYQKARASFVQTVADLSSRPQNVEALREAGVMALLRPLLIDTVPTIQQTAALALGRLANHSDELAAAVVHDDILPQLVYSLAEQNRFYKKAAAFVLRTVAKHSPELAMAVVDSGAVSALVTCLDEFDPGVKEAAAWALGYIARHNAELAQAVVDAGAVPLLILCIQEPEMTLKRISASALSDIAKHTPELAQTVVDGGAIAYLSQLLEVQDAKLKRQVFSALSQIAKHTVDLAELVVEAYIFPAVLPSLKDPDEYVRKNVAMLIREVAKHSSELAQLIVNSGGVIALVDYVNDSAGSGAMPGIMALGYISAFSERLAMSVVVSHGVPALAHALHTEAESHIRAAAAWSLGQIGRHTPEHARHVAEANVLPDLLACTMDPAASDDLRAKASRALKNILQKCTHMPALQALLADAPPSVLENVVAQFAKILPSDAKARKQFVTSGGLKKIQEIQAEEGSDLSEAILTINECFPEEIVRYYSPGYSETLLQRLDSHTPGSAKTAS
ncbi:sperm associated antigen 6 [Salpingoeca rosetta]|uniref:Sperm associated antigen 6 n=1 Tax=Salpingoeca rosetta (strain ATCC 50818 / BSB-021) TaxID=946362 RepID=F2UHJ7_SALR5|nr:sperm associated antigen 6 [Salpingoeca rosetta]EGD76596.1 sperm associated antigen 6 [Salpingoeca rosetta]|eukprot:XP_004991510.1 sperm associated antigen 6 [Salpingoeca rosetta]